MVIAPLIFFSLIAGGVMCKVASLPTNGSTGLGDHCLLPHHHWNRSVHRIGDRLVLSPVDSLPSLIEDASVLGDVTAQSARLIDPGDGSTFSLLNNLLQRMLINPFNALSEMNVLHFGRRTSLAQLPL